MSNVTHAAITILSADGKDNREVIAVLVQLGLWESDVQEILSCGVTYAAELDAGTLQQNLFTLMPSGVAYRAYQLGDGMFESAFFASVPSAGGQCLQIHMDCNEEGEPIVNAFALIDALDHATNAVEALAHSAVLGQVVALEPAIGPELLRG